MTTFSQTVTALKAQGFKLVETVRLPGSVSPTPWDSVIIRNVSDTEVHVSTNIPMPFTGGRMMEGTCVTMLQKWKKPID